MTNKMGHLTLLVSDYDEALDFYVNKLGFKIQADNQIGNGYRWLSVTTNDQPDFGLVFVLPESDAEMAAIGKQAPNRVLFTLMTDDCQRDYEHFSSKGVKFEGPPRQQPFGMDAVFEDLYGNRLDLVQLTF